MRELSNLKIIYYEKNNGKTWFNALEQKLFLVENSEIFICAIYSVFGDKKKACVGFAKDLK